MRIFCFGDSNTYGYDPRGFFGDRYDATDRWVDLLAKKTGHQIYNAGINGRQIPRKDFVFPLPENTDIVLVMLGTNDLLQGASAKEVADRMDVFLKSAMSHCERLLLVAPPPMQRGAWVPADQLVSESLQLAEAYRLLAQKLNIPFVDTRNWNITLTFDGVHFTEAGHHTFAECIAQHLQIFPL